MKKKLCVLSVLLSCANSFAQTKVYFNYDRNGNLRSQSKNQIASYAVEAEDVLTVSDEKYTISVGPSPTIGLLNIKVNSDANMTIYAQNTLISKNYKYDVSGNETNIDMSDCVAGIYQLLFTIKDEDEALHVLRIKIIKK